MEELYSTLLPYGQVHCMTWSGANLVAVSLSEEIPDNVTEGSERFGALWMLSSVFQLVLLCMQGESELHSCVRPRQALDLPQVSSEQVHMILCVMQTPYIARL